MTAKNTKYTIPLLVLAVLIPLGFINAQTTPGDEGPVSEPAYTENPTLSEKELDAKFDDIMFSIIELQVQNDELAMHSVDEAIQDEIDNNNEVIEGLFAELDELIPPHSGSGDLTRGQAEDEQSHGHAFHKRYSVDWAWD